MNSENLEIRVVFCSSFGNFILDVEFIALICIYALACNHAPLLYFAFRWQGLESVIRLAGKQIINSGILFLESNQILV